MCVYQGNVNIWNQISGKPQNVVPLDPEENE